MKIRLNRLPKHSNFEYKPRFFDPEQEKRESRFADYSEGDVGEKLKSQISKGFDRKAAKATQYEFRSQRRAAAAASNRRLLLIIVAMLLLGYLVLSSNLEGVLQALEQQ